MAEAQIQYQVLYWALALLVGVGGAAWKAAGMRGSLSETWADRVDILKTGLSEGAILELKKLRQEIDSLLGEETDVAVAAIANPAILWKSVQRFEKLLQVSKKVDSQFQWMLRLGNILVVSLLLIASGIIGAALKLSGVISLPKQILVSGVIGGGGVLTGLLCFFIYWLLQNKLSGAEILSRSVAE